MKSFRQIWRALNVPHGAVWLPVWPPFGAFAELAARRWDEGNAHFPPTRFQVSNLQSGTGATNVIPGELAATFNLRWSPVQTLDGLKRTVAEILDRHGLHHSIDWLEAALPYYTAPGKFTALVSGAVETIAALRPEDSGKFLNYTGKPYPW